MNITIKKWGNSLGIRIPAMYTQEMKLNEGSIVNLSRTDEGILIIPQKQSRREELEKLVSQITPKNMHKEDFFGKEVGNEIW